MPRFRPPGDCPNCGSHVPARAAACRHCGATADAGWNDEPDSEGDDEFDYDAFVEREFGTPRPQRDTRGLVIALIAGALALAFLWMWFGGLLPHR